MIEKIGEYFGVCLGFLFAIAIFGFFAGGLTIFLLRTLVPSLPLEAVTPPANNIADWRSLAVIAIGCVAFLCFFVIRSLVSRPLGKSIAVSDAEKASRKRWIIGLSIVSLLLAYATAADCIKHYKLFNKADLLATGNVVDVDPGEPAHGTPYLDGGDSGEPPSSHYEFKVNGITYEGWIEDELTVGKPILVRYNSSDPSFNHAEGYDRDFSSVILDSWGILWFIVLSLFVSFVRNKNRALAT
jgi:hypothetical protein